MYFSYLVVLLYCHFIWFYLTCLNLINGNGDIRETIGEIKRNSYNDIKRNIDATCRSSANCAPITFCKVINGRKFNYIK